MLIQRYLFRQISTRVVAACAALAGIGVLSQSLDQLEVIVERGQSVWIMIKLTLLAVPQLLAVILPFGLFVGALIALTRLQREQELTAAFAGGMTRWSVISPALRLSAIVALLALFINLFAQPWAQREGRAQTFAIRTDLAALLVQEGQFVQGPEGLTVYVQQIEQNGLLKNLFVYLDDKDKVTTWNASEARFGRAGGVPRPVNRPAGEALAAARKSGKHGFLRPDSKSQLTVEYDDAGAVGRIVSSVGGLDYAVIEFDRNRVAPTNRVGNVTITGKATGDFSAGDTVTVTFTGLSSASGPSFSFVMVNSCRVRGLNPL